MKKVLGRKQNIKNSDWIEAMEHIEEYVSKEELDSLVEETISNIRKTTEGKRAAYAWSAGKDSIVLSALCEAAGITDCMLAVCNLEYPAFENWAREHGPAGLTIINTGQDIEWLKKNPDMLFPQDAKTAATWFRIVQHTAQARYYRENNLDIILLGRRRADGNYVGRGSNIYTNSKGVTRFSPLSDWPHEAVLAYIHYYGLELPPIYGWENGYLCGTHPWPARQHMETEDQAWGEIYGIDPSIVEDAAKHFKSAKSFLKNKK